MFLIYLTFISCKTLNLKGGPIDVGKDPNFNIVPNNDIGLSSFNKKVIVFGIDLYAVREVEDAKLLHAANVMAQYLDNDEDGLIDNQLVLNKMLENKAFLVMWKKEKDLNIRPPSVRIGQDLGNDETNPSFVSNGKTGRFDATLEEVLHLINNAGHSYAYPGTFGKNKKSALSKAMDVARGGRFFKIPSIYPANAWFSYYDSTCDYETCQTIEYLYWALTSILGAQENRLNEIGKEWKLNTADLLENTDNEIFELLTNPIYNLPTILPDGSYKH
ncbi:hypothetical protein N9848_05905 [Flavobacteriaceae bacterium]|nr:hypothetical protein [Flavobacteriaceae bacterium]MDB4256153.1 hypothetical protein [Flavobacteriaceae bacterium]MDC1393004.1 hypothetical protein [Flavobacteriaceae bacterium]